MISRQPENQQSHRRKMTLTTLPVELLDMVLGHLLDLTSPEYRYVSGPYTGTMRRCGDSVFKAYTSLQLVNRYLAQAAKSCMFTQNSFVILDCDNRPSALFWNEGYFDNLLNHGYIKCVSASSHLEHFVHHVARVDVSTPGAVRGPRFLLLLLVSQLEPFLWRLKYLDPVSRQAGPLAGRARRLARRIRVLRPFRPTDARPRRVARTRSTRSRRSAVFRPSNA